MSEGPQVASQTSDRTTDNPGFARVGRILTDIGVDVREADAAQRLYVVDDEARGVSGLLIDCESDILVIEQPIFTLPKADPAVLTRLLQMNRELVHGAFALDDGGTRVIFRDTLVLETLDPPELEASINALALGLASFAGEILDFAKS